MTRNDVLPDTNNVVSTTHIARQPIYDPAVKVVGYELIVHGEDGPDADAATAGTVTQIGLNLVGNGAAWIPLSRGFLFGGHTDALPPDRVVFQVSPDLATEPEALAAIGRLKAVGHGIAVEPFVPGDAAMPLLAMANFVKIDGKLDRATLAEYAHAARTAGGVDLVAKNVETHDAFESLKELGYDFFQGSFLCEPKIVDGRPIQVNNLNRLRLVAELQDPDVDMQRLATIISRDVGLSYNLLRFVNSAFFAVPPRIGSIREALVLLGLQHVRRWATLMALFQSNDKPAELIVTGLVRARMCELVAVASGKRREAEEYFTTGLFSVVDALLDISLIEVLRQLPFSQEIMDALLNYEGPKGELLHGVLAYERGDFGELMRLVPAGNPPADFYAQAIEWATDASGGLVAVPDSEPVDS